MTFTFHFYATPPVKISRKATGDRFIETTQARAEVEIREKTKI